MRCSLLPLVLLAGLLVAFPLHAQPARHPQPVPWSGPGGGCPSVGGDSPVNRAALDAALARWLPARGARAAGTPVVQVVYLVPADRTENPLYAQSLDASIRHLQQWYSEHLPGGETFALAQPALLTLHSDRPEAWYREHGNTTPFTTFYSNSIADALRLMGRTSGDAEHVWLIYTDAGAGCGQCGGCGAGSTSGGGFAVMDQNDLHGFLGGPWVQECEDTVTTYGFRPCRFVGGAGHELGHAFGLPHPPGCDAGQPSCDGGALMWAGFYGYPATHFTAADQATLSTHPFFAPQSFPTPLPSCDAFVAFDRPHLLEPHDGRFGLGGASPWLVWGDRDEPPQHAVEVATDAAFTTVVLSRTTSDEWTRFVDVGAATEYFWRVRRVSPSGPWSDVRRFTTTPPVATDVPVRASLQAVALSPNPVDDAGVLRYTLTTPAAVRLAVYDMLGREVAVLVDGERPAGEHTARLDARSLTPGPYVVRLTAGDAGATRALTIVR